MSTYAFDEQRRTLIAVWPTGLGDTASTVAEAAPASPGESMLNLAERLSLLSRALWRTYAHPASAAASLEPNTTGWRRERERKAFSLVVEALTSPNLPSNGSVVQSYSPVEESAHRVGRAIHAIGEAALSEAVVSDVRAEMEAIEQAELGNLTGRARQAIALSRASASPAQVEAADRLLHENPFGSDALFTTVEPTAAAVAAAHWLQAAAQVTSDASGVAATLVVQESDNIYALPHETPTLVLELLEAGTTPYDVVTSLVEDAMEAAEGRIPDIESLVDRLEEVEKSAERYGQGDPELRQELIASIRSTPLDPRRPAHDLLEDLVAGIGGCRALFDEFPEDLLTDDEDDEESDEAIEQALTQYFVDLVRAEAESTRDRLQ